MRSLSFTRCLDRGLTFVVRCLGKAILIFAYVVASPVLVPIALLGFILACMEKPCE